MNLGVLRHFGEALLVRLVLAYALSQFALVAQTTHRAEVVEALKDHLPKYSESTPAPGHTEPAPRQRQSGAVAIAETVLPAEEADETIDLPAFRVTADRFVAPSNLTRLPRPRESKPQKDVRIDEFTSSTARDSLLVERHLSSFDRLFLNRVTIPIIGMSNIERAKEAEVISHSAGGLNRVADAIESSELTGDHEEAKKMREEYYRLYLKRPK
ncbi:hypothetical protein DB347_22640 [Opitutaceae bacterium EW11]|nr:hypothetical protein DB347_22640 [Opitutaceae bacterium EW11]